jgi:predicted phosphohydrolase
MHVFGGNWEKHFEKIKYDWLNKVQPDDVVLICGDISWAMKLEDAVEDLQALAPLPGKKVFIRGNHDFWWSGIGKVRAAAPDDSFIFLQTDSVRIGEFVIVGSRGWSCPNSPEFTEHDEKLYKREAERLTLAFADAAQKRQTGDRVLAMVHFPPFTVKQEDTLFTQLFEKQGVETVVFGHIHGAAYFPLRSQKNGITYHLTACDKTAFQLVKIY